MFRRIDGKTGLLALLALLAHDPTHAKVSVLDSPHNLSASGPGDYRSLNTRQACVFCHTPHTENPSAPMWNRDDTGQTYTQYTSSSLIADPGQPTGSSRLCLACHDGTVALERLSVMPPGAKSLGLARRLEGRSNLGTDLADDHPIAFRYDPGLAAENGQLVHPAGVQLPLAEGMMECETCHDPHDNTWEPFLNLPSGSGELCLACHSPAGANWSWESSSHATSLARPRGSKPWRERKQQWAGNTVADNACFNCHTPHNAAAPPRLVVDREEHTCYRCHDGTVASSDIQQDQMKPSRHPVEITPNLEHDSAGVESPLRMRLHVECSDCHNTHASGDDRPMVTVNTARTALASGLSDAPAANARIRGVSGLSSGGVLKEEVDFQYEMCFKCHGLPGRSACGNNRCSTASRMNHQRADATYNLRDKVDPDSNPSLVSYHPIVQNDPSNNGSVLSLRSELGLNDATTLIYCTDCHNSDQSSAGTAAGAEGPHGSIYPPILAERYRLSPVNIGSSVNEAALCFKCHDEHVLRDETTDSGYLHKSHQEYGTCITCHDPHGSTSSRHLVNFGTRNNLARAGASPLITGAGDYAEPTWGEPGKCWLTCHTGTEHLGRGYRPAAPTGGLPPTTPSGYR